MDIKRDFYLDELKAVMHNGLVKVITGIRRSGKSHLLFQIFRNYLKLQGVEDDQIVAVQLDDDDFESLRTPRALSGYIKARILKDGRRTYVLIDEIQECKPPKGAPAGDVTFYDVLNSLMKKRGVDVYVTGSNSEMLSEDIATNFRDRGTVIRMWPLSFAEYYAASRKEKADAWEDYLTWGGMPLAVLNPREKSREAYLRGLFEELYFKDIIERVEKDEDGKSVRKSYEIDFVVNSGFRKVYVQSALEMATAEKAATERRSLVLTGDFFRKIIVTGGNERQWQDEDGIVHVGVIPFLLDETILFGMSS